MLSVRVAQTGDLYTGFAPYVPSINDNGVVAFQAELVEGGTAVVAGKRVFRGADYFSHPDINSSGDIAVYGTLPNGDKAVLLNDEPIYRGEVGPLGPTINEGGEVAFRADDAVWLWSGGRSQEIVRGEFQGLPVVNDQGKVAFRTADGISLWQDGHAKSVVRAGDYETLGNFPHVNAKGDLVFATDRGIFAMIDGRLECLVSEGFESYRGALLDSTGRLAFYATPPGGQLGIYRAGSPSPLIEIGASFDGSTVEEFALNPVSMNELGDVVVRVKLHDSRQMILKFILKMG